MATKEQLQDMLNQARQLASSARTPEQRERVSALISQIQARMPARTPAPAATAEPGELVGVNPEAQARIQAQAMLNPEMTRGTSMEETPFAEIGVPEEVRPQPTTGERIAANITQGLSLGTAPFQQRLLGNEELAQRVEDVEAEAMRTNPVESIVTQLGAGVLNPVGLTTGLAAGGARTLPRAAAIGVLGGGLEGAIESAGRGMDADDFALNVALGAGIPGAALLGNVGSAAGRRIRPNLLETAQGLLEESGVTPQQLQQALTAQPETIPEVAARVRGVRNVQETPLGSTLRGLNTQPGQPRQIASEALQERAEGAQSRVERIVSDAFGGERAAIDRAAAGEAYQEFRAQPWPEDDSRIRRFIESEPEMERMLPGAQASWRSDNRQRILAGDVTEEEMTWNWQTMDEVKKELDSKISVARRQGDNAEVRRLTKNKNDFLRVLEEENPAYARARAIYADGAAKEQAQEMGADYFRRSRRSEDIERDFARLTPAEQEQFRIGALDELLAKIQSTAGADPDYTRKLINTPSVRDRLKAIADDPDAIDDTINRLVVEGRGARAAQQILGGSPTAPRAAEVDQIGESLVRSLLNFNVGDVAARGIGIAANRLPWTGRHRAGLAELLSQSDPQAVRETLGILAQAPGPQRAPGRLIGGAALAAPPTGILIEEEQR